MSNAIYNNNIRPIFQQRQQFKRNYYLLIALQHGR